jgi:hypothetical protein
MNAASIHVNVLLTLCSRDQAANESAAQAHRNDENIPADVHI